MQRVTSILAGAGAAAILAAAMPATADEVSRDQARRGDVWQEQIRLIYPAYQPGAAYQPGPVYQPGPAYPPGYAYQPGYYPPATVIDAPPPAFYAPTFVFTAPGETTGID